MTNVNENQHIQEPEKKMDVPSGFNVRSFFTGRFSVALIALVVVTIVLIGFETYSKQKKQAQVVKKTVQKQEIVRRSKIPNTILAATTAKIIDVKTGKVIKAARIFSVDDKTIYLALDLNKPDAGTRIDYIRYVNGRYVDHGSVKLAKANVNNLVFDWTTTNILGSRPEGKYKVATYTNGILEKRISYTVTKNKVSQVSEEQIATTDPDYTLARLLTRSK